MKLWGEANKRQEMSARRAKLKARAIAQAKDLKPISSEQIRQTLVYVPCKKEGMGGATFQDLKEMPDEALSNLTWFYRQIEEIRQWPQGLQQVVIALLPKNKKAERPVGLLATIYRLWAKLRRFLIVRWSNDYHSKAPWDYAREHYTVFDAACLRQARGEMSGVTHTAQIFWWLILSIFTTVSTLM